MRKKVLRLCIELVVWPAACCVMLYIFAATGIIHASILDDIFAVGKAGVRHVEARVITRWDSMVRETMDPYLHRQFQAADAHLRETLEPLAASLEARLGPAAASLRAHAPAPGPSYASGNENTETLQGWRRGAL